MDPIERMVAEHRVIESVLDALATYGADIERGEAVDPSRLGEFVRFLRGYADAIHHGKEERILFSALQWHGVPPELAPPLAAIQRDHETARLLTGDLASIANREGTWSDRDRAGVVRTIRSYVSLLRRHIRQEDESVFPDTVAAMPGDLLGKVAMAFDEFESEHADERAELEALANRLASAIERRQS